eukprot:TRINITY_DN14182_c1_g1_i1.p1 TRINITY_DN14182_c1_g1~~TRINITY_DN14182_c1_g1_i1.p1  ORF type:complete len:302 (-),score=64.85 TRINITY_DN14182_c1_g1_i1:34-819(-)
MMLVPCYAVVQNGVTQGYMLPDVSKGPIPSSYMPVQRASGHGGRSAQQSPKQSKAVAQGLPSRKQSPPSPKAADEKQVPVSVLVRGLPEGLRDEAVLEVMLEQAGLETSLRGISEEPDGDIIIRLTSTRAAKQCIAHFNGRRWGGVAGNVRAALLEEEEAVPPATETSSGVQDDCSPRGMAGGARTDSTASMEEASATPSMQESSSVISAPESDGSEGCEEEAVFPAYAAFADVADEDYQNAEVAYGASDYDEGYVTDDGF